MPKRNDNWYLDDQQDSMSLSIVLKRDSNEHNSFVDKVFEKIEALRDRDETLTKSSILRMALTLLIDEKIPPTENEILINLIDAIDNMRNDMQQAIDGLQQEINELAVSGVQVSGIQSRANQLQQANNAPAALGGMFNRFNQENS